MTTYVPTAAAGTQYNRFRKIIIDDSVDANGNQLTPTVLCVEQTVVDLASGVIFQDIGNMGFDFNPSDSFPLLDPTTQLPTEATGTGLQAYQFVLSYVMSQAALRDARMAS